MRLGSSILGGKPMRIPGIVDVYQVGTDWVARSWPKVQNQPNSAAQLYWRKRFKDAHALIKSWTGNYMEAWQAIECPKGKMWIDIAMTSIMKQPNGFETIPDAYTCQGSLRYYAKGDWFMPPGYYFGGQVPPYDPAWYLLSFPPRHVLPSGKRIEWANNGWICPNGKRPKIKWFPILLGKQMTVAMNYRRTTADGTWMYSLIDDCPNGFVWTKLSIWNPFVPEEKTWSIWGPPIKFLPTPMTEDWL